MTAEVADAELTEDAALGGRLRLQQPRRGHRFGHDAVLLAAAVPARAGEHAVEFGAGVGLAGLALAARVPGLRVTLLERDAVLADLAGRNAVANGFSEQVRALAFDVGDDASVFDAADLGPGSTDQVFMNPPFNAAGRFQPSRSAARTAAHIGSGDTLKNWGAAARRLLRPSGVLTLIWRADDLPSVTAELASYGGLEIFPVYPRQNTAAIRVLVRCTIGRRAPHRFLPGVVLVSVDGRPSQQSDAILRDGRSLDEILTIRDT